MLLNSFSIVVTHNNNTCHFGTKIRINNQPNADERSVQFSCPKMKVEIICFFLVATIVIATSSNTDSMMTALKRIDAEKKFGTPNEIADAIFAVLHVAHNITCEAYDAFYHGK